jgi:hypothetical protein
MVELQTTCSANWIAAVVRSNEISRPQESARVQARVKQGQSTNESMLGGGQQSHQQRAEKGRPQNEAENMHRC